MCGARRIVYDRFDGKVSGAAASLGVVAGKPGGGGAWVDVGWLGVRYGVEGRSAWGAEWVFVMDALLPQGSPRQILACPRKKARQDQEMPSTEQSTRQPVTCVAAWVPRPFLAGVRRSLSVFVR